MHRLNTPPDLLSMILYHTSRYYQVEYSAQPTNRIESSEEMFRSIESQKNIDWNHFVRGRITTLFQPVVRSYFRRNKLPPKFSGRYWSRHMIKELFNIHHEEWQTYCSTIHEPVPNLKNSAPVRESLLILVSKYFTLSYNLPTSKRKWFSTKIEKINLWQDNEIKRWLKTAKRLIRKFQFNSNPVTNLRKSNSRKSNQHLYSGINKYRRPEHRIIKLPPPTILNQRKVMKLNTYFPSKKSLAINHPIMRQRLEINSKGTIPLTKKIKQTNKNYSTICTSKLSAQNKSDSRINLLSYPKHNI